MEEADFVCGFLNSEVANFIVGSYAVTTGISTHILRRIPIPRFEPSNARLSELARGFRERRARLSVLDGQLGELNRLVGEQIGLGTRAQNRIRDAVLRLGIT
jgi:hypothetical protein